MTPHTRPTALLILSLLVVYSLAYKVPGPQDPDLLRKATEPTLLEKVREALTTSEAMTKFVGNRPTSYYEASDLTPSSLLSSPLPCYPSVDRRSDKIPPLYNLPLP